MGAIHGHFPLRQIMTFSLLDEDMQAISALNQNLRSNVLNDPETFPW